MYAVPFCASQARLTSAVFAFVSNKYGFPFTDKATMSLAGINAPFVSITANENE